MSDYESYTNEELIEEIKRVQENNDSLKDRNDDFSDEVDRLKDIIDCIHTLAIKGL